VSEPALPALPDGGLTSAIAVATRDGNRVIAGTSKGDVLTSRQALTATAESEWAVARPRAGWVTMVEETGFGPIVTEWLSLVRDSSGRKRLFAFTHGRGAWRVDLR
jgi:hypothetical protein